jgi:hypothetical protein
MLSDLSRKSKMIAIAGVATVATIAISVGIAVPAARRSSKNSNISSASPGSSTGQETAESTSTSEASTGQETVDPTSTSEAAETVAACPCYNGESLDTAVELITSGDGIYNFDLDTICTGTATHDGILFSENPYGFPILSGYAFDMRDEEGYQCQEGDAIQFILEEEALSCKQLMVEKCAEHEETLNSANNPPDAFDEKEVEVACTCFTAEELSISLSNLSAEQIHESSCQVDVSLPEDLNIAYTEGGTYYEFGVGSFGVEKTCQLDDQIFIIDEDEWAACKDVLDEYCLTLN